MVFDETYFREIWGELGVHRHDYCEFLASSLITKYGKCKILDVGTGCGYLVKILNDKGITAYGLEISQYAVNNSHGNVLLGSVIDIPFKNNYFDVVFSQGLWEYIPEDQVDYAFTECNRVGNHQYHNFDSEENDNPPEHQKITIKPRTWWNEKGIGVDL